MHELGERFDVALCFGILHRVTDPITLLRALASVLAPGSETVLETYGSRLPADVVVMREIVGLDELEVVDRLEVDGHPRILVVLRAAG